MRHLFKKRLILAAAFFGLGLLVGRPLMAQAPVNAPQPLVELIEVDMERRSQSNMPNSMEYYPQAFPHPKIARGDRMPYRCDHRLRASDQERERSLAFQMSLPSMAHQL